MDTATTITAIIIILICIIPFILINRHSRNKEKPFLEALSGLAQKNNYTVSQHDIWSNTAIGIDEAANIVFFTKKVKDIQMGQQLALAEIKKCRVMITNSIASNKEDSNFKEVDTLCLAFTHKEKSNEEIVLEFYNADINRSGLTGELQLAERWCKIANDKIKTIG